MADRKRLIEKSLREKRFIAVCLCTLALAFIFTLVACASDSTVENNAQATEETETTSETTDGFTPHGTTYGKAETVAVSSDLSRNMRGIAVTEWIKNPTNTKPSRTSQNLSSGQSEVNRTAHTIQTSYIMASMISFVPPMPKMFPSPTEPS